MATPEVKVRLSAEGQQEVIAAFRQMQRESAAAGTKSAQAFKIAGASLNQFRGLLAGVTAGAFVSSITRAIRASVEFADQIQEQSAALGVTTDFFQEMQFAAEQSGAPVEKLQQAFGFLSNRIVEAAQNGEPILELMDGTTIAATNADGAIRGLEEVFLDLVRVFPSIKAGVSQTAGAADEFGRKIGVDMVTFLNLGEEGLARLRAEAHATGAVVGAVKLDNAALMKDQLDALARSMQAAFASGLLDLAADDLTTISRLLTDGRLVAGARSFGDAIRESFGWLLNTADRIGLVLDAIQRASALTLRFDQTAGVRGAVDIAQALAGPLPPRPAGPGSPDFVGPLREEPPAAAKQQAASSTEVVDQAAKAKAQAETERAQQAAERAGEKAVRAAEREADVRARAQEATADFEARLLEQQGKRHEAALAALDIELAAYEQNLRARGDLDEEEIAKRVEVARTSGEARAEFEELQRQSQAAFDDLASQRAQIEEQVARGLISEQEGAAKIAALDKERLANLQAIADAMVKIAEATKDPEQIAAAKQLAASIGQVRVEADRAGQEAAKMRSAFAAAAENEVASFFESILDGSKSVDDAFKDLVKGIEKEFLSLISKQLSKALFNSLLGDGTSGGALQGILGLFGFGGTGYADGGFVRGPGTGTSDSIPARLSAGEYVVRAAAVAKDGMREHLEWINRGLNTPPPVILPRPIPRGYADGGFVTPAAGGGAGGSSTLVLQVDESTMRMTLGEYITRTLASERWRNR